MTKPFFTITLSVFLIICCFAACKKEIETRVKPAPAFATAGTNQQNVSEFSVKLNADSLNRDQSGKWSIVSGLNESGKVYFDDPTKPDTRFHGMPGEAYELKWDVSGYSSSTVKIAFKPLQARIVNASPNNKTQFYLTCDNYDKGEWVIEGGSYAYFRNQSFGGTVIPDMNAPNIKFQGYAHRQYKLTWTTHYGSKSASASITINTGDYLENEGLSELQLDPGSYRVTYERGHITELNLQSSGIAHVLADTLKAPAIQAFTYLKRLNLNGSATFIFPEVIGDKFQSLEYLDMTATVVSSIANNIGKLTKLKEFVYENPQMGATLYSLPSSFGQLENLEVLRLGTSGLKYIPESFGQLKKLRFCDLSSLYIERFPESIGECSALEHLAASTVGGIPASVSKLKNLRYLYWNSGTKISLADNVGNMSALDTIILSGGMDGLPASFAKLPLRFVDITGGLASLPANFGDLRKLERLTLGGSFATLPATITQLPKIRILTIYANNLRSLPADIGNLKTLTYLRCTNAQLTAIPASIGDLPELEELWLGQNTIKTLPDNFFNLTKIRTVDLGNNQLSTLPTAFGKLKGSLSALYVHGNNYPTEELVALKALLPTTYISPYI